MDPIKQIIRYEQQLKAVSQKIQIMILDDNPSQLNQIRDSIAEEDQLIRYLEVQSSKLNFESKQIYSKNMQRYKKKAKEHKDYLTTNHGSRILPTSQQTMFINYQNQNAMLAQNKLAMYDNQRVHDSMGRQLYEQGQKLYGGIQSNRQIQRETSQAQNSINLIKMAIMKRKLMFVSLVVIFILILIFALVKKAKGK